MRVAVAALAVTIMSQAAIAAPAGDVSSTAGAHIDNSVGVGLGFDGASSDATPSAGDATTISQDIFSRRDDAYGAFQRGYYLTALALALPRAEKADPAAETLIAEIYANGLGVAENVQRASSWYALAAKSGDRMAAFELGLLYLNGNGVTEDRKRAAQLVQGVGRQGLRAGPIQSRAAARPGHRRVPRSRNGGGADEIGGRCRSC